MKNTSNSMQTVKANTGYMQGVVIITFFMENDSLDNQDLPIRKGGVGSTTKE